MGRKGLHIGRWLVLAVVLAAGLLGGCNGNNSGESLVDPLTEAEGADLQRNTEVQLVEQMARYRGQYQQYLEVLNEFYDQQGNNLKAGWAQEELDHLKQGPRREYLVIAEVAGPNLQARETIGEADELYLEGMAYVKEGRGALGKLFLNKKKFYLAIDKFNELITNYPTSDKIDDAAFQIGEVYRHYLEDYTRALLYYQRVWQWDAQTPMPARFAMARIYDEHLHDRIKALHYYEQAINLESDRPKNVVYAQNRIDAINEELAAE